MPPPNHRKYAHNSNKTLTLLQQRKHHQSHQTQIHMTKTQQSHLQPGLICLKKRVLELEGVLEVTRNANSLLEQKVDNLLQYQRRRLNYCRRHYPGKR